jgi:hypothetical protein
MRSNELAVEREKELDKKELDTPQLSIVNIKNRQNKF